MVFFRLTRKMIPSVSREKKSCKISHFMNLTSPDTQNWQRQRPISRSTQSGLGSLTLHLLSVLPYTWGINEIIYKENLKDAVYLPQIHN